MDKVISEVFKFVIGSLLFFIWLCNGALNAQIGDDDKLIGLAANYLN